MEDLRTLFWVLQNPARRMDARLADVPADLREGLDLVERHPMRDAVAESLCNHRGIVGEVRHNLPAPPTAIRLLQGLRLIPVVERGMRCDAVLEKRVGQTAVMIETLLVHRAATDRQNARPGDTEAVVLHAEIGHQLRILGIAMVLLAGPVAVVIIPHLPRRVAERVPNARAFAVLIGSAFDLIRGSRSTPPEIGGKLC